MTTPQGRETAKIIPFPARHRTDLRDTRRGGSFGEAGRAPACVPVDLGSGWYHEAAIQEDARGGKS